MNLSTPETAPTFANFDLVFANPKELYDIGAASSDGSGVLPEIAKAFGYTLSPDPSVENLQGLKDVVGPAKTLQDNIAGVQRRLGTDKDAVELTRGWAKRTGFLEPVARSYVHPLIELPQDGYRTIMTDGVANWMHWRAETLVDLKKNNELRGYAGSAMPALLVAGNGLMRATERDGVVEGMPRAEYMKEHIKPYLEKNGIEAEVIPVPSDVGDEVAAAGVAVLQARKHRGPVVVASNRGAWPQNAGQVRRAIRSADADMHVFVKTNKFVELGSGRESTSTHQNPFSATGQIVRNHLEFLLNMEKRAL